jgi:hypothetical protein
MHIFCETGQGEQDTKAMISRIHRARNKVNVMIARVVLRKKD